jgi:transposase-like protein
MMKKAVGSRRWSTRSPPEKKREMALLNRSRGRRPMDKTEKPKVERPGMEEKKGRLGHTAEQKCRAVLSVWTERRKPGEVCRELGVAWSILNQWQDRAMEGMLLALQPRVPVDKGVALNPRLAVLLERKSKGGAIKGLERRLARLQGSPVAKSGELREIVAEKKI